MGSYILSGALFTSARGSTECHDTTDCSGCDDGAPQIYGHEHENRLPPHGGHDAFQHESCAALLQWHEDAIPLASDDACSSSSLPDNEDESGVSACLDRRRQLDTYL